MFIALVFAIFSFGPAIGKTIYGDCVEIEKIKYCIKTDKTDLGTDEQFTIELRVTNLGGEPKGAEMHTTASGNLDILGESDQIIQTLSPGDLVIREFTYKTKNERGRFKVDLNFGSDSHIDREIWINVH